MRYKILISFIILCIFFDFNVNAQTNNDCMLCHEDKDLTTIKSGKRISVYLNMGLYRKSVHKNLKCIECHKDAAVDFPHPERLKKVNCGSCHKEAMKMFESGLHGQAFKRGEMYAPDCKECHGEHDILPYTDVNSRTYKMNIPVLCGKCHREGAPVARVYNISEQNILENYSQDIHGIGLFQSGLIVSATCNDCHGNHGIQPHTNPWSTVHPNNIAETCMKCHARIEQVHKKVINQELWEKEPGRIPACSDCHLPHRVKIKNVIVDMSVQSCMKCHGTDNAFKIVNGDTISLKVDHEILRNSEHKDITCVKCHTNVSPDHDVRPCFTVGNVDCTSCHLEISNLYFSSGHGLSFMNKQENAPYCTECHGSHEVMSHHDERSPAFRTNIPSLCGDCHKEDGLANRKRDLKEKNAYYDYSMSVHGQGVSGKGLLVSAVCTDCHTTHYMLPTTDERSSIFSKNIPSTCASCHKGIYDEYIKSDHAINQDGPNEFPTCVHCHSAHVIKEVDQDEFMTEVTDQCGSCHEELADSYLDTYHGQAYQLGYEKSAKCSDCHNAHLILNMDNPNSSVGINNIVATCQKCHEDANERFTGYLTHATHYNRKKFPLLFYTYWAMTGLLIAVFTFFGIHTLLWLPRSLRERRKKKHVKIEGKGKYFKRFTKSQSITHVFIIISFIMLALTGMMLKFADMQWAKFLVKFFGGVQGAGVIHRIGAVITFGYFGYHIYSLFKQKRESGKSFKTFFFGPESLWFSKQDIKDFIASIKWFIGKGLRPQYGRWTYWEKFDYFAVFWGVAVIGFSGLMLWFPEFFSLVLPGKFINVAQIIHSDEALLAVGFIFTIHFFNTHIRPESFPMDTVIFTGHIPAEEYKEDRPREYEELEKAGKLDTVVSTKEFSKSRMRVIKIFGFIFLSIGIILVGLILYSLLFG